MNIMLRYTVKRFLSMLLTLFLVATATFFLMHAIPGQPFEISRETPDSVREALERSTDWISRCGSSI